MGSDSGTGTCAGWGHPGREQNTAQELEYKMWEEKMDPAGDEGWEQDRAGLWGQLNQCHLGQAVLGTRIWAGTGRGRSVEGEASGLIFPVWQENF